MNTKSSRVYSAPVPKMPPGLVELMEGLARDVLKNNPIEVYQFCAEHMQKLLQIRDGSPTKITPTLEQKIAKATIKVRDRAAQRRDEFDNKMQLIQYDQMNKNYNDDMIRKNDTEAEQYKQENIVKIPQNHLTGNIEHELIAREAEKKSLSSKPPQVANTEIKTPSDLKLEDDIYLRTESHNVIPLTSEHDNVIEIAEELSEIKIKENTVENVIEGNHIGNEDELMSKEDQNEQNIVKENENIEKNYEDSDILVVDENNYYKIHVNISKDDTTTESESIDCKETQNALDELENSSPAITIDAQNNDSKGYDIIDNAQNNQKEEKNNHNEDTITKMSEDKKTCLIENKMIDIIVKDEKLEEKSDDNSESVNTNEINEDQQTKNLLKNKYVESQDHINSNSMDLETAAITIQKVFRSFLFRNKTSSIDDSTNIYMNLLIEDKEKKDDEIVSNNNIIKDRRPLGISRMDTVLQTVNEEKSLSLSTDDSSTLSSAATIIQAHVRGFLVRNNYNTNKTASSTSGVDSDAQSMTSLEGDIDYHKSKTVLNIHIVPEGGHYMSRDESMLTSTDLSLDGSPPNSTNLHPLGYDKSERRKQLKREDAIQSISPPSTNSGKLSEDVDSVKEISINSDHDNLKHESATAYDVNALNIIEVHTSTNALDDDNIQTMINNVETEDIQNAEVTSVNKPNSPDSLPTMNSDEMDVVTPLDDTVSSDLIENDSKLIHSGECHDVVLPTKVSRNDTSVVRGE